MDPQKMFQEEAQPSFPPYPGAPQDEEPVLPDQSDEGGPRAEAFQSDKTMIRRHKRADGLWDELIHKIKVKRSVTLEAMENRKALESSSAYRHSSQVIWPTSKKMQAWDILILVTLFYTLIMTPFQVAFLLETPMEIFLLNRVVDCTLGIDMIIQMFLAYQTKETSARSSGQWVTNLNKIREHYLKTWFALDLVGLLSSLVEIVEAAGGPSTRSARAIQAIRFLRLFRLGRVFVRARSTLTILVANAPTKVGFLATESLTWVVKLVMIAHFVACIFGFIATAEESNNPDSRTWLKAAEAAKSLPIDRSEPAQVYLLALYWAFTTLLTIGYGDIVPQSILEHAIVVLIMVAGGLAWTLLVATCCALATASDAQRLAHGMNMETLVRMCTDQGFPHDLTKRLALFLVKSKRMELLVGQQQIMSKMSPALQSEVAVHCTEHFLRGVDFCVGTEVGFTTALASALRLQIFPPKEWIVPPELTHYVKVVNEVRHDAAAATRNHAVPDTSPVLEDESVGKHILKGILDPCQAPNLTILEGGLAVLGNIHCSGASWHRDLILSQPYLRNQEVAQSLVFCSVYMLAREVLVGTLGDSRFPEARRRVRKAAVKLAFVRMVMYSARVASGHNFDLAAAATHIANTTTEAPSGTDQKSSNPASVEALNSRVMAAMKSIASEQADMEARIMRALEAHEDRQKQMKQHQDEIEARMAEICAQAEQRHSEVVSLLTTLASLSPPPSQT